MPKRKTLLWGIGIFLVLLAFLLSYFVFQVPLFDASGWRVTEDGVIQYLDYFGRPSIGWVELADGRYYFSETGEMQTGWLETEDGLYYLDDTGAMQTDWLTLEDGVYYLELDGKAYTGWLETQDGTFYFGNDYRRHSGWLEEDTARYYFDETGIMQTGWLTLEEQRYYLDLTGKMHTGWLDWEEGRYYLDESGVLQTGWLEYENARYYLGDAGKAHTGWLTTETARYYFGETGAAATGFVTIAGQERYFLENGEYIPLVNPWNPVTEDYQLQLVKVNGYQVDATCADALQEMLAACKKAGNTVKINSAYRDLKQQQAMWEKYRKNYMAQGYSYAQAEKMTAGYVAVPGTSEHHLGLGIDIGSGTKTYNWLAEHCWEYGFILRYPKDKTDVTGFNYEPWHFRYLGKTLAKAVHFSGLTLEEYLRSIK